MGKEHSSVKSMMQPPRNMLCSAMFNQGRSSCMQTVARVALNAQGSLFFVLALQSSLLLLKALGLLATCCCCPCELLLSCYRCLPLCSSECCVRIRAHNRSRGA